MKIKKAAIASTVVGVALALLAAGCSSGSKASGSTTTNPAGGAAGSSPSAGQPRQGGTLNIGVFAEIRGVDPITTNGSGNTGGNELGAVYDRLIQWNPAKRTYDPKVAQAVTANADSTVWTIKLRPGIKFQNGDPLTSDAVKFNIARAAGERQYQGLAYLGEIC